MLHLESIPMTSVGLLLFFPILEHKSMTKSQINSEIDIAHRNAPMSFTAKNVNATKNPSKK